ncbi:MAG: hypothetical protein V4496_00720 [Pseudomonadota bacterium]
MKKNTLGNTLIATEKTAYIVGDNYQVISELSRVITIRQFMIAVLEQRLPEQRLWIVGQGINHDDMRFLRLCETYLPSARFHFNTPCPLIPSEELKVESPTTKYSVSNKMDKIFEWQGFHFIDATRVQAELNVMQLSESNFFAQDFLFTAARELTERACQSAVENGVMIIKQASFLSFHRLFPLPIKVETKFQIVHDNQRSLKSLTRFYQDYACTAEVNLSFDLYSKEEGEAFYKTLAEKTVGHLSSKIEEG